MEIFKYPKWRYLLVFYCLFSLFGLGLSVFITGFALTVGSENLVYLKSGGTETVNFLYDTGDNVVFAATLNTGLNLAGSVTINTATKIGNLVIASSTLSGNSLGFGAYLLTMTLTNVDNSMNKKVVVFYEEEIRNFQISVANPYIPINEAYMFATSMTSGSNVELEWFMDGNGTCLVEHVGQHRQSYRNHTFAVTGVYNVTVVAVNTVSRTFNYQYVTVQYRVHGFTVQLDEGPHNTSQNVDITVLLSQAANIEMGNVTAYVDYGNGFTTTYILPSLSSVKTNNHIISYKYPIQGNFTVNVKIQNEIDYQAFSFDVFIWDQITAVLVSSITKIKVNELTTFSFSTPPNAGFNYEIFYGDGNSVSDKTSTILYANFNVQPWTHSYSAPKVYTVSLTAWNQYYVITQEFKVIVQYPIPTMSITPSANEIPLPDGVQVFDMSMVTSNPSPTNVTCDFDSGYDVENDVDTDIDYGVAVTKMYNYTQNGTYYVLFYCRNEVSFVNLSSTMVIRNFTLPDFIIHYDIVNGMNMTDINTNPYGEMKPTDVPVTVPFRISLFGVTRLPPDITFVWDFGDGTAFETVLISDFYRYHEYKNRGTYNIRINMTGPNETHQVDLHIQMGVIKFASDIMKGEINVDEFTFTASGVIGGTYSFDLLEGNIKTVISDPATAKAKYLTWGRKHAMVFGRNSTFAETIYADPVSPDYILLDMYYRYNESIHYPPGDITVIIGVNHTSHIFPNISCDIFMDDFVEPGNEIRTQNVSYMTDLVFNYRYRTIGEHTRVTINCTNVISYDYFSTLILVKNACFKITGIFDRQYSLKDNPMIAYISDDVDLRNRMPVLCPDKGPRYDWTVEKLDVIDDTTFTLEPFNKSLPEVPTGSLRFFVGEMPEGLYKVSLNVSLPEPPFPTWIYEYTYIRFTKPRPYSSIVGGNRRTSKLGTITINGWEESYDTEVGYGFRDTLWFSWYCYRFESTNMVDLDTKYDTEIRANSNGDIEAYLRTRPASLTSCDNLITDVSTGIVTLAANSSAGNVNPTANSSASEGFIVMLDVCVTSLNVSSCKGFIQQIQTLDGNPPAASIACAINCKEKYAVTSLYSARAVCEDCSEEEVRQLIYRWQIFEYDAANNIRTDISSIDLTDTGLDKSSIVIRKNIFTEGKLYELKLTINSPLRVYEGVSTVTLTVNHPPYDGSCTIAPSTGHPISTAYEITCSSWKDEGMRLIRDSTKDGKEPLTYEYVSYMKQVRNGIALELRIPLFKGSESTAKEILLPLGDPAYNFHVDIVVTVYDYFNDLATYNMSTKVTPDMSSIPNNTDDTQAITHTFSSFNETFQNINASGNILAAVQAIGSVATIFGSSLIPVDTTNYSTSADMFKSLDGSSDPDTMIFTVQETPVKTELTRVTTTLTGMMLTLIPDGNDNQTSLTPFDVSHVVENLDQCITNPSYVDGQTIDNVADACGRLTNNLLSSVQTRKPFSVKKLNSITDAVEGILGVLRKSIDAFVPETFDEPSDELSEETIETEYDNYILYNNIDQSAMTAVQKTEHKEKYVKYLLAQKTKEKEQNAIKLSTAKRNVHKWVSAIEQLHLTISAIAEMGQTETVTQRGDVEISVEKAKCEKYATNGTDRRTFNLMFFNDSTCTDTMELWLTYLHKPIRVYGKDASRLTSPSLTVTTRTMEGETTKRPLEMRIGNEGVSYFRKYQPFYIEGDDDNMIYFIYDIKRKEEATLFYIKPDALDFQDSQKLQEAFADKSSFDLYTTFVRDETIPRVTTHTFKHMMTVSDWTGEYGFKVFIPALFEPGKTYIALKPTKVKEDPAQPASKRRRRSVVETYFDDDIYFDVEHRRYRRSTNSSSNNVTATTPSLVNVDSFRPMDANFSVIIATTSCRSWDNEQEAWVTNGCEVLEMTTLNETVCRCKEQKGNVFATTFYVPPNTIDFSTVFSKFDLSNAAVYGTLLCLFLLYFILLVWARRQDKRDLERWATYFLADSDESDNYFYLITVHTGLRRGAGTKSKVYFVLSGEKADTGVRTLTDGINEGFETGSTRKFFMGTTGPLNDITFLRIWHDNIASGNDNSWYLYKFIVDDLQTNRRYIFACDNWLAVEYGDGLIDRIVPVSDTEQMLVFEKLFSGHARYNITESHLWLSLLMRPEKSYFTRAQRLSCILALLLLTMIASAMFFRDSSNDETPGQIKIGFIRFSLTTLYVSLISVLITTPPILLITMIFKHARPAQRKDEKMKTKMMIVVKEAQETKAINKQMRLDRHLWDELFVDEHRPLPHWTVYIAWVITVLSMIVPAFFLLLYSMEWGKPKSEEWLCTFFLSFFESLCFVDPVKVVVMALLLALLFRKPTDVPNEKVNLDRLKSAAVTYNAGMIRDSKEMSKFGKRKPPSSKSMQRMRRRRLRELHAYRIFFELLLYIIYAFFLYSITYIVRDDRTYTLKKHIENHLVDGTKTLFGFSNISSHEHFFHWMNATLFPQFFPENNYNGDALTTRQKKFFIDLDNTRLGPARLRQVRMKPGQCRETDIVGPDRECIPNYKEFEEDRASYCLNWEPYNSSACEFTLDPGKYYTADAWNYTSSDEIWGISIKGEFNTYGGGGYILSFEDSLTNSILLVNELMKYTWIDRGTRAVFMEFTFYNSNVNLFTYVIFLFEFTELGGVITWTDIRAFRPYEPVGALGTYAIMCYCIFAVVLLVTTVKTIIKLVKQKLNFFKEFWNVLDSICIILSFTAAGFWGMRFVYAKEAMNKYYNDKKSFINFQHVVIWDFLLNVLLGFLVFVATIRILRLLGYNKKMRQLVDVVSKAFKDLTGFCLMFSFIFLAYGLLGYLLFGATLSEYKTIATTFGSLANTLIGKNSLDKMIGAAPAYAQLYFFTYAFFVIFVLLTMFVAILNFSISDVKSDPAYNKSVYGILDIFFKSVKDVLSLIFKIKKKDIDDNKNKRKKKKRKSGEFDTLGSPNSKPGEKGINKDGTTKSITPGIGKSQSSLSADCNISLANESICTTSEFSSAEKKKKQQLKTGRKCVYTPSDVECILHDFDDKIKKVF